MRNPPEAERLQVYLRALRQPCTVLVSASHASFFKPAPRDAHAYIVQDPARPWVHHWTRRDGTHVVLDKKQSQRCPGFSGKVAVHIKDLTGKAKKKAPRYRLRGARVRRPYSACKASQSLYEPTFVRNLTAHQSTSRPGLLSP